VLRDSHSDRVSSSRTHSPHPSILSRESARHSSWTSGSVRRAGSGAETPRISSATCCTPAATSLHAGSVPHVSVRTRRLRRGKSTSGRAPDAHSPEDLPGACLLAVDCFVADDVAGSERGGQGNETESSARSDPDGASLDDRRSTLLSSASGEAHYPRRALLRRAFAPKAHRHRSVMASPTGCACAITLRATTRAHEK
jgi:hypothetical protein